MAITTGSIIEAADYNALVGPTTGAGATVNQLWSIGSNDYGYGQTALSQVAAGNTVTATQWANLINTIRSMRLHQNNTAGAFTAPVAGSLITASTIACQSEINNAQTNRLSGFDGGTTTSAFNYRMTGASSAPASNVQLRTVLFSSIDQCRYFWNANGRIEIEFTGATNNNGTARSASIVTLTQTNFGKYTLFARSASGRTGSGGNPTVNLTSIGFYSLLTTNTMFVNIDSTSYYTDDFVQLNIKTNGGAGLYSGNGNLITLQFTTYSSTTGSTFVNDDLDVTVNYNVRIIYPPTTYLANSWGTATIA
jgi:hypothetical protein